MICITLDTDWVTDIVLGYSLDILQNANIKSTVFATGEYSSLKSIDPNLVEIGIHPNIVELDRAEETIQKLLKIYPDAISLRNHSLVHSSRFWAIYTRTNISFTSNYLYLGQPAIRPVLLHDSITECPIYFMDDYYLTQENKSFTIDDLKLSRSGLKILAFHPIHIFLNSSSLEDYDSAKPHFHDQTALEQYRSDGNGIGTLFKELVSHLAGQSVSVKRLKDVSDR